ncbi:MAG: type II secretion system protein [Candidatus Nomurabacteria bacterium]|nr:MAG: type II secretion system protein [Candidatus Nomurabacteria bacterium]
MGMVERGFTIIEVMLFLGITGVLFAALMIGVNSNLTQQRYRDGVIEYSSLLKNQYSEVLNTQNARTIGECASNGVIDPNAPTAQTSGTSQCVLLGRAVQVEDNGTSVKISNVVGLDNNTLDFSSDDVSALKSYAPKVTTIDEEKDSLGWGTTLYAKDSSVSQASVLILRSPVSGLIKVFWSPRPLTSNIDISSMNTDLLKYCVRGDAVFLPVQSVSIDPSVAGASGVTVMDADPDCVHHGGV